MEAHPHPQWAQAHSYPSQAHAAGVDSPGPSGA
jgi:hypothetical protein